MPAVGAQKSIAAAAAGTVVWCRSTDSTVQLLMFARRIRWPHARPAGLDNVWASGSSNAPFDQEFYLIMNGE